MVSGAVSALTRLLPRVGQRQPQREDDGEEHQVGALLADATPRERHVQRLGGHLVGIPTAAGLAARPNLPAATFSSLRDTNLFLQWRVCCVRGMVQ